ncbi:MAG: ABC transporter ATP-binding protein, partial [Woeseia sp.]
VRHPKVLLLDEPLGALDKNLREQMQYELRELQRDVGITFILVTHDQEEALSMSDRIAVMQQGRVLQIASPLHVYERPNCSQVARFIGDMNFLSATTETVHDNGRVVVRVGGFGLVDFSECLAGEAPGHAHTVAIRPEKIQLAAGPSEAGLCTAGTVQSAAYWGDQSHLQVSVDGCDAPLTVALRSQSGAESGLPSRGDRVWLSLHQAALLRFAD